MLPVHPRCFAIKGLLICSLMLALVPAHAQQQVANVLQVSGVLLKQTQDGAIKVLKGKSAIDAGDVLTTQAKSYAQIRLTDESRVILQPGTTLVIESIDIDASAPEKGKTTLQLKQGGVRITTASGSRGGNHSLQVTTPAGIIDMENASAVVNYFPETAKVELGHHAWLLASSAALDAAPTSDAGTASAAIQPLQVAQANLPTPPIKPPGSGGLAPGLYVHVIDGLINLSNKGGSQNFSAGQFGYSASLVKPPVVLPANPGIQFTPPTTFSANNASPSGTSLPSGGKAAVVDCEVR